VFAQTAIQHKKMTLNIQNYHAHISILECMLKRSNRNNKINIGDKILFNFENFQNIEADVTSKNGNVNKITSYVFRFKAF
jgi:translation initiation factor IF-1